MDTASSIVIVIPVMTLIALFTGIALPFIAASRSGRGHPAGPLARAGGRKRADAADRMARPRETGADDAAPAGYLYVPCGRIGYHDYPAGTRRWVQEVPIVRKTAKLIYYASDSWDRREAVVSPGCISRDQFETDTLCRDDCPAGTRGVRCAKHAHRWQHCPHGDDPCRHGYPAGVIPIPGHRHRPGAAGRLFFATRQAAEDHLYLERERAEQAAREAPSIKELRRAMADAHPDRGGTAEQFIQARRQYQTAVRAARRYPLGRPRQA
jgi:hypothetical protein